MLLSYLEAFTVETSIWLKKSEELSKNTIIKIFEIKQQVEAELEALQIELANEFKLLCPNCTCHGADNHLVDVLVYKHPRRKDIILRPCDDKCEKTNTSWNLSKYTGTGFGKYINSLSHENFTCPDLVTDVHDTHTNQVFEFVFRKSLPSFSPKW